MKKWLNKLVWKSDYIGIEKKSCRFFFLHKWKSIGLGGARKCSKCGWMQVKMYNVDWIDV